MKGFLVKVLFIALLATSAISRNYVVYNIGREIPMSDDHKPKKNFYINIGSNQGVEDGTVVDVYRIISRIDPYKTKKRFNHKVKVAELQVIHTEQDSAIGALKTMDVGKDALYLEVDGIMIGDHIAVKIDQ